jgi:hypothetical protein
MNLDLYYQSSLGKPPRARAIAWDVRETKTMYIVRGDHVKLIMTDGARFGWNELRFSKKRLGPIPAGISQWRIDR